MTVEATMLRTGPARPFHLMTQSLPGPVYANGGILRCDARLLREVAELALIQIHDLERLSVVRLESRQKAGNTPANLLPHRRSRFLMFRELSAPGLHCPFRGGPVTVMIDHGVTQDPIKPGHHPFIVHTSASLQSAGERCLQNVFSDCSGLDTTFQEGQKLPVSFHQLRYGLGR
jgi:hypothetical protein